MKSFEYSAIQEHACSTQICKLIAQLHEDKGKFDALRAMHAKLFEDLRQEAFFDNVDSSARIEGIYLDENRVSELCDKDATASDNQEKQISGYAEALRFIEENAHALPFSTAVVVAFHDMMYEPVGGATRRSSYRKKDYADVMTPDGIQRVKVSPITAFETPLYLGAACDSLAGCLDNHTCTELLYIPYFTVDFLCIRPFSEGNGRITRLLTHLILARAGVEVTSYMSLDRILEESGMEYYDALNACVLGWDVNRNTYEPFALYWLTKLHECYERLFDTVAEKKNAAGLGKSDRIRAYFKHHNQATTKADLRDAFPDISVSTIENALRQLVEEGIIEKVGSGRSTAYRPVTKTL